MEPIWLKIGISSQCLAKMPPILNVKKTREGLWHAWECELTSFSELHVVHAVWITVSVASAVCTLFDVCTGVSFRTAFANVGVFASQVLRYVSVCRVVFLVVLLPGGSQQCRILQILSNIRALILDHGQFD